MTQKIAVALIHGIGKQKANYADQISYDLKKLAEIEIQSIQHINPAAEFIIEPVYWAPVIQKSEDKLWENLKKGGEMDFKQLRRLMIDFAGDAIAYQQMGNDRSIYDGIHRVIAKTIKKLAKHAGESAPLCIIAHGLGSVIASNYIYDIQNDSPQKPLLSDFVKQDLSDLPIEQCQTLCGFFTLGSPLPLWGLRYKNFGIPIKLKTEILSKYYSDIEPQWWNYYDKDDIIGYPLKTINKDYNNAVNFDFEVNVGTLMTSWNPASHAGYWNDADVINPIARYLGELWKKVNKY